MFLSTFFFKMFFLLQYWTLYCHSGKYWHWDNLNFWASKLMKNYFCAKNFVIFQKFSANFSHIFKNFRVQIGAKSWFFELQNSWKIIFGPKMLCIFLWAQNGQYFPLWNVCIFYFNPVSNCNCSLFQSNVFHV